MTGYQSTFRVQGKAKKVAIPEGYESNDEFLKEMRERLDLGISQDIHNRQPAQEDVLFWAGNQWDPIVLQKRVQANKPTLTVDRLGAFVAQVINNRLMNETDIRVLPDSGGTKDIASIREGLIKSIYKNSNADFARDEAQKYQVVCGVGYFCLAIDYAAPDVFDQEIRITHIADPMSVVIDPMSSEPTGADAEWGFVVDDIPEKEFKKRWPDAPVTSIGDTSTWGAFPTWYSMGMVKVASYWRMVTEGTKTLALMKNGVTLDVTDLEEFEYQDQVQIREDGSPYVRDVPNRFARMYVCSGQTILEGPYDYPISSLPIFRVSGWEARLTDKLYRWGLVRKLKDPQRLHNYWRSVLAEQLLAAPRNKWLATREAVQGFENQWRQSNLTDDPLLLYNSDGMPPQRVDPPGVDAATLQQADMTAQDMRDVSNIHEASMGVSSNEVSARAIYARQSASDLGSFIYVDRLRMADERCACVINELIPHIYDAPRIIKIIGPDDKVVLQAINDPMSPENDVTIGKYFVTVTTGPATATKRQLAAEQMATFVNAVPQSAPLVMDLVAEAQDWPKSAEFARRFRLSLPPGTIPPDDITPEMQQIQAQQQQAQQQQQELATQKAQAEIAKLQAEAEESSARGLQAQALARKAIADARARLVDVSSKADDREINQVTKVAGIVHSRDDQEWQQHKDMHEAATNQVQAYVDQQNKEFEQQHKLDTAVRSEQNAGQQRAEGTTNG